MAGRPAKKTIRKILKPVKIAVPLGLALYFLPYLTLFLIGCGMLDFARNRRWDWPSVSRYFFGNGLLTWALSPVNLFADLICQRNRCIYRPADLPEECQAEIRSLIAALQQNEVVAALKQKMADKKRGMIFFKWYGRNIGNSIRIPEFDPDFRYVRTIGVSVFNRRESTTVHFGPLRFTLRVLYNLDPSNSENVFIEVMGRKHLWRDDPLFIFDDTLMHRSVNDSDDLRYCMFVDVLRPSYAAPIQRALLGAVRLYMLNVRGVFYKNWEPIT